MRVVVTGGAGFLGSHLVDALMARGDEVVVYDLLDPQVHAGPPTWLHPGAEYHFADPREGSFVADAASADALVHLAASTGTGQSMYLASSYTDANAALTAHLSDLLVNGELRPSRVVFASSRAVYGEGTARCPDHGRVFPGVRRDVDLERGLWDALCPTCGRPAQPEATREDDPLRPLSVYAATKQYSEQLLDFAGAASNVPVTSLRFFNLYGPRQTPSNPYVGVASTFAAAVLRGQTVRLFEDGQVVRDFLHVHDASAALLAALDVPCAPHGPINIGSGTTLTLQQLATALAEAAGLPLDAVVTGQTRRGDLRACVADIDRARSVLGWTPQVGIEAGIRSLLEYVADNADKTFDPRAALSELASRGLLTGALT